MTASRIARTRMAALIVALALIAAACGGGQETATAPAPAEPAPAPAAPAPAPAPAEPAPAPPQPAPTPTEDPKDESGADIELPAGPPTEGLPGGRYVQLSSVTEQGGTYAVDFEAFNFTPLIGSGPEDFHIHFFFNDIAPENAGTNGPVPASWSLYDGPSPFTGMGPGQKPAAATEICALVADANHGVTLQTGNCLALPA